MTANASWSVAPAPSVNSGRSAQGNASWGMAGPGKVTTKENIFLKRMQQRSVDGGAGLAQASLLQGPGVKVAHAGEGSSRFDVNVMLLGRKGEQSPSQPTRQVSCGKGQLHPQMISSSVSTSALSHATLYNSSQDCIGSSSKLREETLRSLGISRPSSRLKLGTPLRSALKKHGGNGGGGMSRAVTMASIREVEVCLPFSKTITRTTSINFNEAVKVREIPSSSSLAQHKNELWFQDDEMKSMRQKARSMASMAEINGASDDVFVRQTGDTLRGLERYMNSRPHGRNRRNKYELWDAVMDEQEDMRYYGKEYDDEKIAGLCRSISVDSLRAAQLRAQNDALAVRQQSSIRTSGEA